MAESVLDMIRFEHRKQDYQNVGDVDQIKKKHEDYAIKLRKKKRNFESAKRRTLCSFTAPIQALLDENTEIFKVSDRILSLYPDVDITSFNLQQKLVFLKGVMLENNDEEVMLETLIVFRRLTIKDDNKYLPLIVSLGIIDISLKFLDGESTEPIKIEASHILCNITGSSSEYSQLLIDADGIQKLIEGIDFRGSTITLNCIWALGNLSAEYTAVQKLIDIGLIDIIYEIVCNDKASNLEIKKVSI